MLTADTAAPDFILPGSDGDRLREYALSEFTRDGPVVLAFYRFDFHPDSADYLRALRDADRLDGATVLGVSTDSAFSHRAFARELGLDFPLLSDDAGAVIDTYGVPLTQFEAHRSVPERSLFAIDGETSIRYAWAADDADALPDWDEAAAALGDR